MRRYLTLLAALVVVSACERDHDSRAAVDQFAIALQYGDTAGLFAVHVDSTQQGEFCRKKFRDLLEKARGLSPEGCEQVRALTARSEEMPDELALAAQTGRWVCENPEGSCVDYARTVFEQAASRNELLAEPVKSVKVQRLMGDATAGVAYLDIQTQSGALLHRALKMKLVGEGWRIAGGFLTP